MRTLIVDDSKLNREGLKGLLANNFPIVAVVGEANSVQKSIEQINKLNPELVFLDIELGDGTAFEMLKELEAIDFSIIFVTAYNNYAIEAFDASAIDYVLKPINIERLKKAIQKVLLQQNNTQVNHFIQALQNEKKLDQKEFITITSIDETEYIKVANIIRFEADGKYTSCVLTEGVSPIVSSDNLGKFERELNPKEFLRIHHSHIINRGEIKKFSKKELTVTMTNGDVIPVAQRKKDFFLKSL